MDFLKYQGLLPAFVLTTIISSAIVEFHYRMFILLADSFDILIVLKMLILDFFAFLMFWCYYRALAADPGQVGTQYYDLIRNKFDIHELEGIQKYIDPEDNYLFEIPVDNIFQHQSSNKAKQYKYGIEFCRRCNNFRPERAHHCSACGKCICRFDHHCPWTGNCVGHLNHKFFILFLMYATISMSIQMFTDIPFIFSMFENINEWVWSIVIHLIIVSLFCSVIILLFLHLQMNLKNRTTFDINDDSVVIDKYRKSMGENLENIFGSNNWFVPLDSITILRAFSMSIIVRFEDSLQREISQSDNI